MWYIWFVLKGRIRDWLGERVIAIDIKLQPQMLQLMMFLCQTALNGLGRPLASHIRCAQAKLIKNLLLAKTERKSKWFRNVFHPNVIAYAISKSTNTKRVNWRLVRERIWVRQGEIIECARRHVLVAGTVDGQKNAVKNESHSRASTLSCFQQKITKW